MERGGEPKRSYAGGKIRETQGEIYYTKLNATITVCETKGVQKTQKQSSKESSKTKYKVQIKNQSSTQTGARTAQNKPRQTKTGQGVRGTHRLNTQALMT